MKRIFTHLRAAAPELQERTYLTRLQNLWEDRWMLLGGRDRSEWLKRHDALPTADDLLVNEPQVRTLRRLLDRCPDLPQHLHQG